MMREPSRNTLASYQRGDILTHDTLSFWNRMRTGNRSGLVEMFLAASRSGPGGSIDARSAAAANESDGLVLPTRVPQHASYVSPLSHGHGASDRSVAVIGEPRRVEVTRSPLRIRCP